MVIAHGPRARWRVPQPVTALAAQVTLAASSLVLQLFAARELGAAGLGQYALLFGAIVMATAVSTGLIGDTLTVLDRHEAGVRAALLRLSLGTVAAAATTGLVVVTSVTDLPLQTACAFAGAMAAFLVADLLRRLMMATLRFGRLVVVDGLGLVASIAALAASSGTGQLQVHDFVVALMVGQLTACSVAWLLLPAAERLPASGTPVFAPVLGFGIWRAGQQFVRPTALNAARWLVLVSAGHAAVGELEAARVFVAPALLLVQGIGSYLFASYAADRDLPLPRLLARADRAAAVMLLVAAVTGAAAAAGVGVLGPLLTGGSFQLETLAVLGWTAYAASCAAVLPYGSLAAVRGHQAQVLVVRVLDSSLSLAVVAVALLLLGAAAWSMPWLLCVGSFVGGWWCRRVVRTPTRTPRTRASTLLSAGDDRFAGVPR